MLSLTALWLVFLSLILIATTIDYSTLVAGLYARVACAIIGILRTNYAQFLLVLIFMGLMSMNLAGILPYLFTVTGGVICPGSLALVYFTVILLASINSTGWHYLVSLLPNTSPEHMLRLLVLVESISLAARSLGLGLRLFANMLAGHVLIKLATSFIYTAAASLGPVTPATACASIVFLGVLLLELLVAILQAYVFAFLSVRYFIEPLGSRK